MIFVDEAYQLNPETDSGGRKVLDMILTYASGLESGPYGKLVFVFSGYTRAIEKLFQYNPGLPRRFPRRFRCDFSLLEGSEPRVGGRCPCRYEV